jgi:hypothetical protein
MTLRVLSANGIAGVPYLFSSSFVALSAHTGTTNETTFWTIPVPAGLMGTNGILRISAYFGAVTSSGNVKTIRFRMGASGAGLSGSIMATSLSITTNTQIMVDAIIANRNSAASQFNYSQGQRATDQLLTAASHVATTRDTATLQDIVITGQLATGGETMTPEGYMIELIRAS